MLAATAAALSASLCSSEILELISWASVESCDVEAEELTERVLSDGESKLEFLAGYVGAGARSRPLPRTRPPPSFREDMIIKELEAHEIKSSHVLSGTRCGTRLGGIGLIEMPNPISPLRKPCGYATKMDFNISTLQCRRNSQLFRGVAH